MKKEYKAISIALIVLVVAFLSFNALGLRSEGQVVKDIELPQKNVEGNILDNIEGYEQDLRQITCYCGCEHTDLYNCYEEDMLTECGLCMKEYKTYLGMKDSNTIKEISAYVDNRWGAQDE